MHRRRLRRHVEPAAETPAEVHGSVLAAIGKAITDKSKSATIAPRCWRCGEPKKMLPTKLTAVDSQAAGRVEYIVEEYTWSDHGWGELYVATHGDDNRLLCPECLLAIEQQAGKVSDE